MKMPELAVLGHSCPVFLLLEHGLSPGTAEVSVSASPGALLGRGPGSVNSLGQPEGEHGERTQGKVSMGKL